VSYWAETPDRYVELARDAGYDAERVAELREAVALEAYYQSYQDKRELVADLLFEDSGNLAAHVSRAVPREAGDGNQNRDRERRHRAVDGVEFAVLDTDGYTHRYDFPPTPLLLDDLHRRNANGEAYATVGIGMDELYLRTTADVSVRDVAERTAELAPGADVTTAGLREGKIEFLSGGVTRSRTRSSRPSPRRSESGAVKARPTRSPSGERSRRENEIVEFGRLLDVKVKDDLQLVAHRIAVTGEPEPALRQLPRA